MNETILSATTGTVFLRGGFGDGRVFLGLARSPDPDGQPEILIELTDRQISAMHVELRAMEMYEEDSLRG